MSLKNIQFGIRFLAVFCLLLLTFQSHSSQLLNFQGKATDLKTGELLYVENHQIILNDQGEYVSGFVSYQDSNGEVFAEKTLDYAKSKFAPDMTLHDKRSDERLIVSLNASGDALNVLFESENEQKESLVEMDEPLVVVDAGFDRLIDTKWQELIKRKELKFTFLAITRAQLINFEAIETASNEHAISVELHPRNFFINMLVDPISLQYDQKTKRLIYFEGLTNIEKFVEGRRTQENYVARIDYVYEPIKPFVSTSSLRDAPN